MTEKTRKILKAVADKNGVTAEQVENEIKKAIRQAMASDDPQAQALWKQIAPDGSEPDLDAFLEFVTNKIYLQ